MINIWIIDQKIINNKLKFINEIYELGTDIFLSLIHI